MSLMVELTPEVISIGGGIGVIIGWGVTHFLSGKDKEIVRLEAQLETLKKECATYRERIDVLQDREMETLRREVEVERQQAHVLNHLAKSLDEHTNMIRVISDRRDR